LADGPAVGPTVVSASSYLDVFPVESGARIDGLDTVARRASYNLNKTVTTFTGEEKQHGMCSYGTTLI
jgi:hypothetical protein